MNSPSRFLRHSAGRYAKPDAESVVVGVAQDVGFHLAVVFGAPLLRQCRGVLGYDFGVHRESPRGDGVRLGLDRPALAGVLQRTPDHALAVGHRVVTPVSYRIRRPDRWRA